ncbi:MAG: capsule assembly Wzi family protein [Muribaculaceae bacterium]|nr:capsule assembly Wzi family protein [Muribaculaceae bacterium]
MSMTMRLLGVALMMMPLTADAQYALHYEASLTANAGSGDFAPHYISALKHGKVFSSQSTMAEARLWRPMDSDSRFDYGFGVSALAGISSAIDYDRYYAATGEWGTHSVRPKSIWLQELWGSARWRSIYLEAGMKEHGSALLNQKLTSGDLIESGNTRPIPQVRMGFAGFQPIPFTNGWVEIQGEVAYGKLIDDGWRREQYNYWNYHLVTNELYNYKRLYLRTKPEKPLSVIVGLQTVVFFGGHRMVYANGKMVQETHYPTNLKAYWDVFFPHEDGGEAFYTGNHVGAWDLRARYRLKNCDEISAYFSWPWEDGSGIGKMNGWDGLWGLEYKSASPKTVSGVVLEYLDFTNQSGPIHYAPSDYSGTTITDHASGADDYYNNNAHSSFAYFGRSLGSPALMAPAYNRSGYAGYLGNAMRGFHIGIEGEIMPGLTYIAKGGYRKAWGNGKFLLPHPIELTAVMIEASWQPARVKGLTVEGRFEIDRGNMPCNTVGAQVGIKYNGLLQL